MKKLFYILFVVSMVYSCGGKSEKEKAIREEERTPGYSTTPDTTDLMDSIPITDDTVQRDSV